MISTSIMDSRFSFTGFRNSSNDSKLVVFFLFVADPFNLLQMKVIKNFDRYSQTTKKTK